MDLWFGIVGFGSSVWILFRGSLVCNLWLGIFGLESWLLNLWFRVFGFGSLVLDLWFWIFGFVLVLDL